VIPRKPGEQVKTNRRDARKLVELGRAELLTAVQLALWQDGPPLLSCCTTRRTNGSLRIDKGRVP
jgi:hypothetical protein